MKNVGELITKTNGRWHIAGTGVTVNRVVRWHLLGRSPEEIVDTFGHVTLAQVYAVLAHYYVNQHEIDVQIAIEEEDERQLEAAHLNR